ncbi:RNA polymerase sigma factor sigma-70 region 4 domain-containing protein [Spirosoma humi]
MKQVEKAQTSQEVIRHADHLTLYDQYSSMAYGIILRIIPEPERAQAVLIDLFSSPQLNECADIPAHTAGEIIRLARLKALAAKSADPVSSPILSTSDTNGHFNTNDNLENTVFDLSFFQGYSLETVAEKLHLSRTNVLKFIYAYFKHLRSS